MWITRCAESTVRVI